MRTAIPLGLAAALIATAGLRAADKDLIPPQLPRAQQENLLRFLEKHQKPDRYYPADARVLGARTDNATLPSVETPPNATIKQYTVQITPHRPVPGQEEVKQVDVYYYRPNPEKGKQGITVKHTVDVTTGNQVGQTEVLLNHHAPMAREELGEAVELAKEKSAEVKGLYQGQGQVRWEYLQLMVQRKNEYQEPGDRVVRLVFTAAPAEGQAQAAPVRVIVNLTKSSVVKDDR